jgi:hypothetical protein
LLATNLLPTTTERRITTKRRIKSERLPDHLLALPESRWALWRTICLRGAGFPASYVLKLAAPECVAEADHVIQLRKHVQQAQERALEEVRNVIDAVSKEKRVLLVKALRHLKKGTLPGRTVDEGGPIDAAVENYRQAQVDLKGQLPSYQQTYRQSERETSRRIGELAGIDRFREAVVWQNRRAYETGIAPLLRRSPEDAGRDRKHRGHEDLVINYLQRYCLKNDTIGFFGPVGWARFVDVEGETMTVRPGANGILAARKVFFEGWGLDELARKLSADKEVRTWIAPRVMPYLHVNGSKLTLPFAPPVNISLKQSALLRSCDGERPAREIVAELLSNATLGFKDEQEIWMLLEYLCAKGFVSWTLEVPIEPKPERSLQVQLERIGNKALRERSFAAFAELEEARQKIAASANNPDQLESALGEMETTFTRLTGVASTRLPGKTYAGRTLVYEDCRRDIDVEIGPKVWRELASPLSLLLTSARWYTLEVARTYRPILQQAYETLSREAGSGTVEAMNIWRHIQHLFFGSQASTLVDKLAPTFQKRWLDVLRIPEGVRQVSYTVAELHPRVQAAFGAPRSGWQVGRYHCPDIMIAADSVEAIRRDDYLFVMGEMHLGVNTIGTSLFLEQQPAIADLRRAVDADLPMPRLIPLQPKTWPNASTRVVSDLATGKDYRLALTHDSIPAPGARVIPVSALVVEQRGGDLLLMTRDGQLRFQLMEALGDMFSSLGINSFKILPPWKHRPRITVDRLVVCRESWNFSPAELDFVHIKDDAERFVVAREWAQQQGMPRFVFVKVPVEVKPFYLDFDSPVYVSNFAKMIRRTSLRDNSADLISLSEMLPRADQTWLPDADDQRYTSEFRIVALDLAK